MNRNSVKARRICFEAHRIKGTVTPWVLQCHACKGLIDPVRQKWRADHIVRHAEGGAESAENLWPICLPCDTGTEGKAAEDTRTVAKGKRNADKHFGVKQSRGFPKPKGAKFDWSAGRYVRDDK